MDLDFTADQQEFREELRSFLMERLPSDWAGIFQEDDEVLDVSFGVTRAMAERGWLTQLWPREYGGADAPIWRHLVLQEELWAHFEPRGGQYMGVNWIGPSIMHFGTEDQKQIYLPRIAAGDVQWAQLFSEPDAGSDLANLSTKAYLDGDHFVINGEKIWTSYADFAEYGFLVARSLPGSKRRQGISVLLIELDNPGIEIRPIPTPLGPHEIHSVVFTDAVVPASTLLGPLHEGWKVATTALSYERTGASRYARATRILGELERHPAADDPIVRDGIAQTLAVGRAAELMNYAVIAMRERGEIPPWQASAARVHNVAYERRVMGIGEPMLGTDVLVTKEDGHAQESGEIEEFDRHIITSSVTAGTYEVQMGIVASRGLGLERD